MSCRILQLDFTISCARYDIPISNNNRPDRAFTSLVCRFGFFEGHSHNLSVIHNQLTFKSDYTVRIKRQTQTVCARIKSYEVFSLDKYTFIIPIVTCSDGPDNVRAAKPQEG